MAKIVLTDVVSGYSPATINANFQAIASHLNTRVLYRTNPPGEPNALTNVVDMNGQRMLNLPAPASDTEPMRRIDVGNIGQSVEEAVAAAAAAAVSATNAAISSTQARENADATAANVIVSATYRDAALQYSLNADLYRQQAAVSAQAAYNNSRLTVGTVATSAPGSNAEVTINGIPGLQEISFVLPRGATGPQGIQGERGIPGPSGDGTGDVVGDPSPTTIGNLVVWGNIDGKYILNSVIPVTDVERVSRKGVANGYAPLGADGKVPITFLPNQPNVFPPTHISPSDGAINQPENPLLIAGPYVSANSAIHQNSEFQLALAPGFSTVIHTSGELGPVTQYQIPSGILLNSTTYYWRVRYRNSLNEWSAFSNPTGFTTAVTFNSYIPTPAATPAIGDPFEGGFYVGMVRQVVMKSTSSQAVVGAGNVTFTVDVNMTTTPKVYAGQALRIKSVSSGAYMDGTVAGARNNSLTITVTGQSGTGTYSDWAIFSNYRVIAAAAASRLENVRIATTVAAYAGSRRVANGWDNTLELAAAIPDGVAATVRASTISGRTDWYVPSRDEMFMFVNNLKREIYPNNVETIISSPGVDGEVSATSPVGASTFNTVPPRTVTASDPARTTVLNFMAGGPQALTEQVYWLTSTLASDGSLRIAISSQYEQGGIVRSNVPTWGSRNILGSCCPVRRSII